MVINSFGLDELSQTRIGGRLAFSWRVGHGMETGSK
jgi:hypothetical protein